MAVKFINKKILSKTWMEIYNENFKRDYFGLYGNISDEVIITKDEKIIFQGSPEELENLIVASQHIASCIECDLNMEKLEDSFQNVDYKSYVEFVKNNTLKY